VCSAGAIASNSGFQSGSEYSRSQLETSAAQKDSFFARRLEVRPAGGAPCARRWREGGGEGVPALQLGAAASRCARWAWAGQ
jgi:hypothetical protein